jgi:hypothetical protein
MVAVMIPNKPHLANYVQIRPTLYEVAYYTFPFMSTFSRPAFLRGAGNGPGSCSGYRPDCMGTSPLDAAISLCCYWSVARALSLGCCRPFLIGSFGMHRLHSRFGWAITLVLVPSVVVVSGNAAADARWHIKAVHPEGRLLDIKAIDKQGNIYDVKAFEEHGNRHLLDVKAIVGDKRIPVKVLVSEDKMEPIKAILGDGTILDIKALTPDGKRLDVKGVKRNGTIIHIKAIGAEGEHYGVKAISPRGQLYDVKGIKMLDSQVELKLHGVEVAAHIKALPQVPYDD